MTGRKLPIKEYISTGSLAKTGYFSAALRRNGACHYFLVHRLVAEAFISNPGDKPTVNHKNGIKTDNRVENLEWATVQENNIHAIRTGLRKETDLEKARQFARLKNMKPVLQYDLNRNFIKEWESISEAARTLDISMSGISKCCNNYGNMKKAGGYIWEFKEENNEEI